MSAVNAAEEGLAVRVDALSGSGEGVARLPGGKTVFVHRTAPGDEVVVERTHERPRWARARLVSVVRGAPSRRVPPCPLYATCGGCTLQHMTYDEQLSWKRRFVSDALRRIGGVEVPPPPITPSPKELGYRNRMTFTLRRLRGGRVVAGLHRLGSANRVHDIAGECLLAEAPLLETWTGLRAAWGRGARRLPAGGRLRLTLRTGGQGVVLLVAGGSGGWDGAGLAEDVPGLQAVWHRTGRADRWRRVAGAIVEESWGADTFELGGAAFLQVNREIARPLAEHVVRAVGRGGLAVDAYAGVAVYGRMLAHSGWSVTAIESDPDACAAARSGAPAGLEVVQGRVEDVLGGVLPADAVVLNPPRTGLDPEVPEVILAAKPPRVVYVSCDPATLARDVARLSPAYSVTALEAFDLFPQTAHVESVATLEPASG